MATAIEFENIGKQYRLGVVSSGTLHNDLKRWWTMNVLRKEDPFLKIGEVNDRSAKGSSDYVWALQDINFKVEQGDVLGIIGKNGAGKSTLLKLLSRVTGPTTGTIRARGRIGSLLEVGTGFHPEMTGRENIYLNGAILGMSKQEIDRKLDEIIDFSGCERYIDTPTKRYSSGMTVRLGFAVAAHLDPEILVVDEVLAVGDAEFQKKAIGKMQDVSRGEGRTVLFVSHNMTAIKSLCRHAVILDKGRLVDSGEVDTVVTHYLRGDSLVENHKIWNEKAEVAKGGFELLEIGVRKRGEGYTSVMRIDQDLELVIRYRLTRSFDQFHITWHLKNEQGHKVCSFSGSGNKGVALEHAAGVYEQICHIPANYFNWGSYSLDMFVIQNRKEPLVIENDILNFTLANRSLAIGAWMGKEPGDITPRFKFDETQIN